MIQCIRLRASETLCHCCNITLTSASGYEKAKQDLIS